MKVNQIIATEDQKDIIKELKAKRYLEQPEVDQAKAGLDPLKHDVFDKTKRPDKKVKVDAEEGGAKVVTGENPETQTRLEPVARIALALQKLIVKRAVAFLFGNPVELEAEVKSDKEKLVLQALKRILYDVKSTSLNRKVARQVFSCKEVAELWYPVPVNSPHGDYGFKSKFKLRVAVFSPLLGDTLYPYFDESGDMVAFSREFKRTDSRGVDHTYFETYTDEEHWLWEKGDDGYAVLGGYPKMIEIGKIPVVFGHQSQLEWEDVQVLINRLETLLSNFADTNDYHASPKIFVKGEVIGFSKKGESGAIIQGDENSSASYLSWQHAPEAVKLEIETLLRFIYTLTQTPDIAFDSVKGLGTISGVALKLLFMDAHLKAADKKEIFDEYLQRRINVIKAFIAKFDTTLIAECQSLVIEPDIQPFMIDDEKTRIDLLVTANGGKPVVSQKRAAELAALANDTEADFKQMEEEAARESRFLLSEPTDV